MDIPVYCGFRHSICLLPGVEAQHLDYDGLASFVRRFQPRFDRVFIVLRAGILHQPEYEPEWRAAFGSFITDLVYGRLERYPGVTSGPEVRRTHVFAVDIAQIAP